MACALAVAIPAHAGMVLDAVKARGELRCGVSEGIPGFSAQQADGRWSGMDADFCRAVAAAALGDPARVRFVPLKASARFVALQSKAIDLLARNTTWTLTREAVLRVQFPAVIFYDGQAFMVPAASRVRRPAELAGMTVCVEKGTTHVRNLAAYFERRGLAVAPLVIDSSSAVAEAFFAGRCQAYTSDGSQLAAVRAGRPGGKSDYRVLDERISSEPLAPAVADGDREWTLLVRWVLYALVLAEDAGLTQADAAAGRGFARLSGPVEAQVARAMAVAPGWAARAVGATGNYGELYDRHFGPGTPLAIERGPNRLWNRGGLLYAPPAD